MLFFLSLLLFSFPLVSVAESSGTPALFVFGDSIVDSGNNKFLAGSTAYVDYLPYGIDFYSVTGRFTNARTLTDVLGQLLGIPDWVPCYLNPNTTGTKILHGVNYASAGSGILDNTTTNSVVIPLRQQIAYFEEGSLPELAELLGSNLSSFLADIIFAFNTGANDYITDCFGDTPCNLTEFTTYLLEYFTKQLKLMYSLGARKFVLFSTEASGCTPVARSMTDDGSCDGLYTYGAVLFNNALNASIDTLNEELPGAHFVFANVFQTLMDIIADSSAYGFVVNNASCCETSSSSGGDVCTEGGTVCADRKTYVYFDGGHPSDQTNLLLATAVYSSNLTSVAYPYNVKQLASISSTSDSATGLLRESSSGSVTSGARDT